MGSSTDTFVGERVVFCVGPILASSIQAKAVLVSMSVWLCFRIVHGHM
jgi:uncharacterized membrane protein